MENFELITSPEITYKVCGECKQNKTIIPNFSIHFRKDRNRRTIASHCKECVSKKSKIWHENNKHTEEYKNKEKIRQLKYRENGRANNLAKTRYHKYKKVVFDYYGNKCSCCGETFIEFLTIEHVLHDGQEHRLRKRSGIYKDIIDQGFPDKYTLFCSNCNFATRYGKPCPHNKVENINRKVLPFILTKKIGE